MLLRRRFCKRIFIILIFGFIAIYGSVLLFGDLRSPVLTHLTELDRCPACYGVSVCPELYSNAISFEPIPPWSRLFNSKNIYYGITKTGKKVVLKKLAHDWELRKLDAEFCHLWNYTNNCKPSDLLNQSNLEDKVSQLVKYDVNKVQNEVRKGLILCPNGEGFNKLMHPILSKDNPKYNKALLINVWTMLKINPEPILLQILTPSQGWPVPAYGGACGRLVLASHSGEPIMNRLSSPWIYRLHLAKQILKAAMDFTFKHDRFRFYLMDWSLDNIVVNENDKITFIDLEDVIVLDKHAAPNPDLPDWYMRYHREIGGSGFTFSILNMCKHHLSDHNLWAACYILSGDDNPLLMPIPDNFNKTTRHLKALFEQCLNSEDRFKTVPKLLHVIEGILDEFSEIR